MSRAITIFCIGSLLLAALYILQQSVQNYQDGGDLWKQGDWLINSELGPVRRAFLGNIILRISDISNTSPLLITWLIQVILLTALITLLLLAIKSSQATPIIWTIILSPAFFFVFLGGRTTGQHSQGINYLCRFLMPPYRLQFSPMDTPPDRIIYVPFRGRHHRTRSYGTILSGLCNLSYDIGQKK